MFKITLISVTSYKWFCVFHHLFRNYGLLRKTKYLHIYIAECKYICKFTWTCSNVRTM